MYSSFFYLEIEAISLNVSVFQKKSGEETSGVTELPVRDR